MAKKSKLTQVSPTPHRPLFLPKNLPPGYSNWQEWYSQNPNPPTLPVKSTSPKAGEEIDMNRIYHRQTGKETGMFNPLVVQGLTKSSKGALGMAQAMPAALAEYKKKFKEDIDVTIPENSVKFQKWMMGDLMGRNWINHSSNESDTVKVAKALAAYNYGPTNVINTLNKAKQKGIDIYSNKLEWLKELPEETSDYVNKILLAKDPKFEKEYAEVKDKYWDLYSPNVSIKEDGGPIYNTGISSVSTQKTFQDNNNYANTFESSIADNDGFRQYYKQTTPGSLIHYAGDPATGEQVSVNNQLITDPFLKNFLYTKAGYQTGMKKDGGPVYNWIPPNYPRVGARNKQGGWLEKYANGSTIEDQRIPTPTTPSYYPDYPDRTLTNYQMGTPKSTLPDGKIVDATPEIPAYAHGATVWTKQTTPTWVAGTPTRTTTQRITPQRAQSPGTQVPYPEIKITGPTDPYSPSSPPVLQGYNPYKGPMRLHAPDTTRMAYGGYVPSYGLGSTVGDIGKLFANTLAAPLEQVTGNNFVNFNYANKGMANAAAVSEGILGGAADVVGTSFLGPAYGMGKGQLQQISKGIGTSQEKQRGADKWANKTGQLTSSAGNLVAGIASGNPQQIVGGAGELLGTAGSEFNSKALGTIGQLGSLGSMFVNPGSNTGGGLTNANLGGVGDINVGATDMMFARNGGRITSKYKKRVGIPYAVNPGASDAGMYVGPTNQRGITFADGGDVLPFITSNRAEYEKRLKAYNDSSSLFKKYYDPELIKDAKKYNWDIISVPELEQHVKKLGQKYEQKNKIRPIYFIDDAHQIRNNSSRWVIYPQYAEPKQKVIFNPDIPNMLHLYHLMVQMPMRGLPSDNIEAMPQKVNVPESNPLPTQYMDTKGEWSNTPQVPPVYSEEQLLKMGYRKPVYKKADGGPIYNWIPDYPRTGVKQYNKQSSGGWLDNL